MKPALVRIRGETPTEEVWSGSREGYVYFLKHEYPAASWDWAILLGSEPAAFGDAPDRDAALVALGLALDRLAPPPPPPGGFAGMVGRLLWGSG